jgi:hypothetical protein
MTNQTTKEYLNYFVISQNPNFAVMLKGKWGAGKTYFISGLIEEWDNAIVITKINEIALRPIYISLNGISKKSEIIEALKAKISPFLYSKGVKFTKEILKGFFKTTLKIDFDYNEDDKSDGNLNINFDPITIFRSSNEKIKGNRILIFDDVERCKIPIDELYGFINEFVEHSLCKVILISDEDKIDKEHTKDSKYEYLIIKEKIIGQTFEIKPDTEKAIDFFLNSVTSNIKPHLIELKDLIVKTFEISKKENLRILQRAVYDFERLINFTDEQLSQEKEKYESLIRNYLVYFLIYFLEFKTGNEDIYLFQELHFFSDDKKEKKYTQYEEVVSLFSILHSTRLFTPFHLINFIKNGDYTGIVTEINNSSIYANGRVEKDWERLWYWQLLDDDDFSNILNSVTSRFFKTEDFHITEILHISGILLTLINDNLYNKKSKSQVVIRAKKLIKITNLVDFKDERGFSTLTWGSWNKQYSSNNTEEFKSLVKFTQDIIKKIKYNKYLLAIKEIFYHLTNDNIDQLIQKTGEYNED